MISSSSVRLLDRSSIAQARRESVEHACKLGWSEAERSNTAIVATELATNLVRHAREGVIAISSACVADSSRLLLVAVDHGPGISNLARCFEDGYSSGGSSGTGLGAVSRLAHSVDVFSTSEGTVLVAEMRGPASATGGFVVGGLSIAKEGETVNGDGWDFRSVDGGLAILVCDGLGHGAYAGDATAQAIAAFRRPGWRSAMEAIAAVDEALRPTRGAAAVVALIEAGGRRRLRYCGVGNIAGCIIEGDRSRHLVSHNGILGHTGGRMSEFEYEWSAQSTLVLHSDGISSRWQANQLPPVWLRHPGLVAGMIYRDFSRGNDDVVTVVARQE